MKTDVTILTSIMEPRVFMTIYGEKEEFLELWSLLRCPELQGQSDSRLLNMFLNELEITIMKLQSSE